MITLLTAKFEDPQTSWSVFTWIGEVLIMLFKSKTLIFLCIISIVSLASTAYWYDKPSIVESTIATRPGNVRESDAKKGKTHLIEALVWRQARQELRRLEGE